MLKLAKGYKVTDLTGIEEGFEIRDNYLLANVDADKQSDVIEHFICIQEEPLFFILEIPTNQKIELELGDGIINDLHKDVYYIDGCSQEFVMSIFSQYKEILINDGMIKFGFASHITGDEIMVNKYGEVIIFSKHISSYADFYEEHNIAKVGKLKTAWDNISYEKPGESDKYILDGKCCYDLVEDLKEFNIYFGERREDI